MIEKTEVSQVKGNRISKTDALNLMKHSKGRFFTAVFTKKDGTTRELNCQYLKDQGTTDLGYVKVSKSGRGTDKIRSINLQTIKALYMSGRVLKVN